MKTRIIFISIALLTFIHGILLATQYSALNSLAYADLNPDNMGSATSILSTVQQIALSFGLIFAEIRIK